MSEIDQATREELLVKGAVYMLEALYKSHVFDLTFRDMIEDWQQRSGVNRDVYQEFYSAGGMDVNNQLGGEGDD